MLIFRINAILDHLKSLNPAARFGPPVSASGASASPRAAPFTVSQDRRIAVVHRFMHRKTKPRRVATPHISLLFIDWKTAFIPDISLAFIHP